MKPLKVNLLANGRSDAAGERTTATAPATFFLSPIALFAIFLSFFLFGRLTATEAASIAFATFDDIPIIGQMRHLISSPDRRLAGEVDDRINILLLGIGGEGHEGPNLTDTIILASIKPSTKKVTLLSVPRDLLVPLDKHGWRKINSANAFGEMDTPGRGADFARTAIEGLFGLNVPYYVRIDFNGFKDIVDGVGGIDAYVERSFVDNTYPTNDYGVQMVSFKEGWQHFDGEQALRYTRSRHGSNGEGSDFARAKRQQKVLSALKDKLLSADTFRNPAAIANTLAALQANVTTNIQIGEILRFGKLAKEIDKDRDILRLVLGNDPKGPLTEGAYGGAYVLVPKNDDWNALRTYAADAFMLAAADPAPPTNVVATEVGTNGKALPPGPPIAPKIELRNGSGKNGVAREAASDLKNAGFEIVRIGNADVFTYAETVIYDLTGGKKPEALARLKEAVGANRASKNLPKSLKDDTKDGVDFLVILGGAGT